MKEWDFKTTCYKNGQIRFEVCHNSIHSLQMELDILLRQMKQKYFDMVFVADMREQWRRDFENNGKNLTKMYN